MEADNAALWKSLTVLQLLVCPGWAATVTHALVDNAANPERVAKGK